MKMDV